MRLLILTFFTLSAAVSLASEVSIIGQASVIDGDTIEIRGERIRLHGIDAPESSQRCVNRAGELYRCGARAAFALEARIGGRNVECVTRRSDRYGRAIAVCAVAETDLGAWLVESGHAVAYRQYSADYVDAEERARAGQRGVWQGPFDMPWVWRKSNN